MISQLNCVKWCSLELLGDNPERLLAGGEHSVLLLQQSDETERIIGQTILQLPVVAQFHQ